MEFRVHTSGQVEEFFHGDSTYRIGEHNGVLKVVDDEDQVTYYSPAEWMRVVEKVDYDIKDSVSF